MVGWIISIAFLIVYLVQGDAAYLIAAGLFAIAGSIGLSKS